MDISVKKLPKSEAEIVIRLSWDEWKGEMDHAAESLAKEAKVSGFRPGKAPRQILEQRFGKGVLLSEAAEHAVSHSYPKALEQEKIEAIGRPEVKLGSVAEGDELEYTVRTAVMPEVSLKDWQSAVKKINKEFGAKKNSVEESEAEAEIKRLAEMRAKLVAVRRPARLGDNVLVDFTVSQEGAPIENGTSENHPLVLGKGVFIPGFEEEVIGMKEGEEKTFTLAFPEEYHAKHLAGKPAEFAVKLRVVQEREIPEVNDEFAKSLGSFASLEELKKNILEGLAKEKETKQKEERRTEILDALVSHSAIDYPDVLVQEEADRMLREFETQLRSMGLTLEQYAEQMDKPLADLRAEWEPQAQKRLAAHLILDHLAAEQDIAVSSEEVETEMNKALQNYRDISNIEKKLDLEGLYTALRGQLVGEKTLAWLETL